MHDGIELERSGIPEATICTEEFTISAEAIRMAKGAEDFAYAVIPHPISNRSEEEMDEQARGAVDQVAELLRAMRVPAGR
ncbi:MAG: hypothetical protein ACE5JJ_06440 [Nitrospinota bacterium]